MYVWTQYRFAFLSMPATASVSVSHALLYAGATRVNNHHAVPDLAERHWIRMGVEFDATWTVATTVRGHRAWFESMWMKGMGNARKGRQDVITVEWLKRFAFDRTYFPNPYIKELFWKYTPYASDIWQTETLQADMDRTFDRIGAPRLELGTHNVSTRDRPGWLPEAEAYVEQRYGWHSKLAQIGREVTYG